MQIETLKWQSPLMTMKEAVEYLRLNVGANEERRASADAIRSLEYLVEQGRIRPTKGIGRSNRFHRDELDRFMREATWGSRMQGQEGGMRR